MIRLGRAGPDKYVVLSCRCDTIGGMEENQQLPTHITLGADNVYRTRWSSYFFVERNGLQMSVSIAPNSNLPSVGLHQPQTEMTVTVDLPYAEYEDRLEWEDGDAWITVTCPYCGQDDVHIPVGSDLDPGYCADCGVYTTFYDAPNWAAEAKAAAYDRAWDTLTGY
jgi:hypothetical protein